MANLLIVVVSAFTTVPPLTGVVPSSQRVVNTRLSAEKVEVCGFKDCRRAGGGARLEKLVKNVLEEKGMSDTVLVEGCDCQGECGYGPNIVVDGKLINGIKGKEAILQALGIEE